MSTMYQIFVSHSKYDQDILASFDRVFARTGVISKCMEFEEMSSPEWQEIQNAVHNSEAVFLLLGQNVTRSIFTQNWIAFEVGLACAYNKRVWVFEQPFSNIPFPIPYLTDYMIYDLQDISHFNYVRGIIEAYRVPDTLFVKRRLPEGVLIKCNYCYSQYSLHYTISTEGLLLNTRPMSSFHCPSCRRELVLK